MTKQEKVIYILRSYSWLTFCVVVWGSNFVFGKILVEYFSPTVLTMLRLVSIVIFLLSLSFFYHQRKKIERKMDWLFIILLGVVGVFINQWSFFVGLETADPTTAALILATTPILAGVLAAIFLHEKITLRMGIGSFVAITGIFYVVTKGDFNEIQIDEGLVWIVLTMVTFAIMIILTRYLGNRVDAFSITIYSNIVALMMSIPFTIFYIEPVRIEAPVSMWIFLIITGIVVHGLATLIWNNHIRDVDASKASILSNLEPFVAMVAGFILLKKPITLIELIGAFLIVFGVVLSTYQRKKYKDLTVIRK